MLMPAQPGTCRKDGIFRKAGLPGALLYIWLAIPFLFPSKRDITNYNVIDFTGILQVGMIFAACLYSLIAMNNDPKLLTKLFRRPLTWFVIYLIWNLLVSFNSYNIYYSILCVAEVIACLIVSISLIDKFGDDTEGAIKWLCTWGIVFATIIVLRSHKTNWLDITQWHDAAVYATTPMFFLPLFNYPKLKKYFWIMLFFTIMGTSAKVYVGLIVAVPIAMFFSTSANRTLLILAVFCGLTLFLLLGFNKELIVDMLIGGRGVEVIEVGNGRFTIWPLLWDMAWQSPLLGYGFAMAEKLAVNIIFIYMTSSHNVFLTAFLYGGLPALGMMVCFFIDCITYFFDAIKLNDHFTPWLLATMICTLIFINVDQGIGNKVMISCQAQIMSLAFCIHYIEKIKRNKRDEQAA